MTRTTRKPAPTGRLTAKQRATLQLLAGIPGPSSGYVLAVALDTSREGVHRTCASLVRRGYATRTPAGPRGMAYTITDAGREAVR